MTEPDVTMDAERPLTVVFMPNVRQTEKLKNFTPGSGPDPHRGRQLFAAQGIKVRSRDLNPFPWNPLARRGSFWAGFDPLRVLKVLLCDRDVDVVVSVFESNAYFLVLLAPLFRFKPKLVMWEVSARGWEKRDHVVDVVARRVHAIFVLTQHQQEVVQKRYGQHTQVMRVGFAVDEQFYAPQVPRPVDEGYVLAVGDDVGRDYSTLIEACAGTALKLKLRTSVKLNIPASLREQVEIIGRISYPELRELYARAAVVVVPLHDVDHPSGITGVFEALSMGCALVASDTGTARDFVIDGHSGLLVKPGGAHELRGALQTLRDNPSLRSMLASNAAVSLRAGHRQCTYIGRFSSCLRQVVSSRAAT